MKRRTFLTFAILAGCTRLTGCGTILHPERRGAPHSRDIDWSIVALDGLGLLLFFVPGVIAFAVDFATGAIYLPQESYAPPANNDPQMNGPQQAFSEIRTDAAQLVRFDASRQMKNLKDIEVAVYSKTGKQFELTEETQVSELESIRDFDRNLAAHKSDKKFGDRLRNFVKKLNPVKN